MATVMISVRCTREEYMEFCAKRRKATHLPMIGGAVLLCGAVASYIVQQQATQTALLLVLLGLIGLTLEGLWLPLFRKGEAGRRYDASDSLQQAISLTLEGDTLQVKTATQEGTVPLSLVTAVEETDKMLAIVFGKEWQVYIPKRVLCEDEEAALREALNRKG